MDNETLKSKTAGFYNYIQLKDLRNRDIVNATSMDKGNVSNYMNRRVKPSENFILTFEKAFKIRLEDYEKVVTKDNNFSDNFSEKSSKDFVLNQLKKVKRKGSSEGRIIDESELIPTFQYIVPIKGQAGLKKAFFAPDEYIDANFEKESIFVKPQERAVYYKIEVDGNSMPGILEPGDWTRCEDIPRIYWLEKGIFKPEKVYCLFHRKLGILFKRISKCMLDTIVLSSDNPDKVEYPDQTFDLMEFSKILLVKKVERDL